MTQFNPNKPYNSLPLLPPKINWDEPKLLKAVNAANIALAELNGQTYSIPNIMLLSSPLVARESVESSEIENIITTLEGVLQAQALPENFRSKAEKEVLNYEKALFKGFSLLQKKGFLSTNDFVKIQSELEPSKTGIRKLEVKIQNVSRKAIVYTPPAGEKALRDLLKNLEDYFNEQGSDPDPLIRMALLHYQFEAIHPFLDGNGRTGRILNVLYLIASKRLNFPILFLSEYVNKNRNQYYTLLREITEKGNWKDWVLFLLKGIENQSQATSAKILNIFNLLEDKKAKWREKYPSIYSAELVEHFFERLFVSQKSLSEKLKIARQTAAKYLQTLEKKGELKKAVRVRNRLYFIPDFLKILTNSIVKKTLIY